MRQCWDSDPDQRPNFFEIQSNFVHLLEETVANYGYLQTTE